MAEPFATVADLVSRGRTVPRELTARAEQALSDASTFLRSEIGWQVYPATTLSTVHRGWSQNVRLPGSPVREITSVASNGVAWALTDYELVDGEAVLRRPGHGSVISFRVGFDSPPDELTAWTCVLAADELSRAEDPDDPGGARPASESLADWRVTYSKRQQEGDLPIPERVLERLRSTYGRTVFVA